MDNGNKGLLLLVLNFSVNWAGLLPLKASVHLGVVSVQLGLSSSSVQLGRGPCELGTASSVHLGIRSGLLGHRLGIAFGQIGPYPLLGSLVVWVLLNL